MEKRVMFLMAFLLSGTAFAQLKIGPEAGITVFNQVTRQTVSTTGAEVVNSTQYLPAFRIGANMDYQVVPHFSLQAGIFYQMNRTGDVHKTASSAGSLEVKERLTLHYINVPVYALYASGVSGSGRFFIGGGPYFNYAVAGRLKRYGKENVNQNANTWEQARAVRLGDEAGEDDIKPFDMGLGAVMGYEFPRRTYLRGTFSYGLSNLMPGGDDHNSISNLGIALSFGFYID